MNPVESKNEIKTESKQELKPRLSLDEVKKAFESDLISANMKYINVLPFSFPSKELIGADLSLSQEKAKNTEMMKNIDPTQDPPDMIQHGREGLKNMLDLFKFKNPDNCRIKKVKIANTKCEWISYKDFDGNFCEDVEKHAKENGCVILVHGGAYFSGSVNQKYAQSELICKLTGQNCLLIDYDLAPEYLLPYCIDQITQVFLHMITKMRIPAHKITMEGESAGGGAILLVVQKLRDLNHVLPGGIWCNSGWFDLSNSNDSWKKNSDVDAMIGYDPNNTLSNLIIGNFKYGKTIKPNSEINPKNYISNLQKSKFSPLFASFENLCPMYLTVGCSECLLDDTIMAADKANKAGVDVKVELLPFMPHAGTCSVSIPESQQANIRACEWINQIVNKKRYKKTKILKEKL